MHAHAHTHTHTAQVRSGTHMFTSTININVQLSHPLRPLAAEEHLYKTLLSAPWRGAHGTSMPMRASADCCQNAPKCARKFLEVAADAGCAREHRWDVSACERSVRVFLPEICLPVCVCVRIFGYGTFWSIGCVGRGGFFVYTN